MKIIITKQPPDEMQTFYNTGKLPAKEPRKIGWLSRLVRRWRVCPKQAEINRLRRVLHSIADSRPDAHMDIEKNLELVNWICDTCHKASVGAYPSTIKRTHRRGGSAAPITLKTEKYGKNQR
jgi:hypothetical protein